MNDSHYGFDPVVETGDDAPRMRADVATHQGVAHIQLRGDFTYHSRQSIASLHRPLLQDDAVCVLHLDLAAVTTIDNAGLGMLLLMHDRARQARKWLVLSNAAGSVKALFAMTDMSRRVLTVPVGGRLEDLWHRH